MQKVIRDMHVLIKPCTRYPLPALRIQPQRLSQTVRLSRRVDTVVVDTVVAAVCAARAKACGSGLCGAVGAGTGRLVPLRLVAANEVMLYPIEEEISKRDSWIWVG